MKTRFKHLGLLFVMAMLVFVMTGCPSPTDPPAPPPPEPITLLNAAIINANTIKAATSISADGSTVATVSTWVDQATWDTFNSAITAAITVRDQNPKASSTEINNATAALNAAITVFNEARSTGTKEVTPELLQVLIDDANTIKETAHIRTQATSNNLMPNELWVTQAELNALNYAITSADNTIANDGDLVTAYTALNAAKAVFEAIRKAGTFVAVSDITGVPDAAIVGRPLILSGTVAPANATNRTIVWTVQNAGGTGATIEGNVLSSTTVGTVIIRATITNGTTTSSNYTKDFNITVNPVPAYDITLSATGLTDGSYSFDNAPFAYTTAPSLTVTVTNTGNQPTGNLNVALSGANAGNFTLTGTPLSSIINTNDTTTFTVAPNIGLGVETYSATITVSGGNNISASFNVSFTVSVAPITEAAIDITAPVFMAEPATTASITTDSPNFTITSMEWDPIHERFQGSRQYTATITLTANNSYTFTGITTGSHLTIGNGNATIVANNDNTLTLSRQFPATAAPPPVFNAVDTEETLETILLSIRDTPGTYTVNVTGSFNFFGIELYNPDVTITIRGTGSNTLTWRHRTQAPQDSLFFINTSKLILENITLERSSANTLPWTLVNVRGGTLAISEGVIINDIRGTSGQSHTTVTVGRNGSFTMTGGTIRGGNVGIGSSSGENVANGASINITGGVITNTAIGISISGSGNTVNLSGNAAITESSESAITIGLGSGHKINISGNAEITDNERGIHINPGVVGITLTMTGGTIMNRVGNSRPGIQIQGDEHNVNISGGTIYGNSSGISIGGSTNVVSISGGVAIRNNTDTGIDFHGNSSNNTLTISSGEIHNNPWGIRTGGIGHNINISGNTVIRNNNQGIDLYDSQQKLNISGNANIRNNVNRGIGISGSGNAVTISDNVGIRENGSEGLTFFNQSSNNTLTITGGEIHGSQRGLGIGGSGNIVNINNNATIKENSVGISISNGSGHQITISGSAAIIDNQQNGIAFSSAASNNSLSIAGGTIRNIASSTNTAIYIVGSGNTFNKTGGTVSGRDTGSYSGPSAIIVTNMSHNAILTRYETHTASDGEISVTINAAGNDTVTPVGGWD